MQYLAILTGLKACKKMLKIIVSGPESSGKTTLCVGLAKYFKIPFLREYAREYISNLNKAYTKDDLLSIAKKQYGLEQINSNLVLCDTDLITIKIWSKYKYGDCDKWINRHIEKQKEENRFYLLCKGDITWQYDPQRENPTDRDKLFNLYKKELNNLGYNYTIIEGENRKEDAIKAIKQFLPSN